MAVITKQAQEMSLERDADPNMMIMQMTQKNPLLSALNKLDSEVDEGDDPKELDFDNDTWSLAGGDSLTIGIVITVVKRPAVADPVLNAVY